MIIPTFDSGGLLRATLHSLARQTFTDWSAVVVSDDSPEDLSYVSREFPSVAVVRQRRGGVSVARNRGILETSSEFVCFMDHDDLWRPSKLARQVDAMDGPAQPGVVYCGLDLLREPEDAERDADARASRTVLDPARASQSAALSDSLIHFRQRFVVPSTVMLRRSVLAESGLLDPLLPFSGDFDLLIKLGARFPVVSVDSSDVLYRVHGNNYSRQYRTGMASTRHLRSLYKSYGHLLDDRHLTRTAQRSLRLDRRLYGAQAYDAARVSVRQRNVRASARHLATAAGMDPTGTMRSLLRWMLASRSDPSRWSARAEESSSSGEST